MYREDQHQNTHQDQQDSADPRVQARRALQAAYDWRDDEQAADPRVRRELAAATAPSTS